MTTKQQEFLDNLKNPQRKIIQDTLHKFQDNIEDMPGVKETEVVFFNEPNFQPEHQIRVTTNSSITGIKIYAMFIKVFPEQSFLVSTSVQRAPGSTT